MKLLQNILTAVDFDESLEQVIENSKFLAKKFNSKITLMHVYSDEGLSPELQRVVHESISNKLDSIAHDIRSEKLTVSNILIESGVAFEKIIQEAQKNDYNVIIAGTGNTSNTETYKLGTTVEKLMRKNHIPLWVVKGDITSPVSRIVCPVDFSDSAERALKNAITLAERFEAELTILNVFKPVHFFSTRFEVDNSHENRVLKTQQDKEFNNFLKQFDLTKVKHVIEMRVGEPYKEILNYIKDHQVDLLLMGTTGKTGLSRLLMGSVTEKVTREIPCSFITTKAQDITDSYFESNLLSVETIINSARSYYRKKEYEKAIEKFSIALKQYPDNIPVITGLIEVYKETGDSVKVLQYQEYAREVINRIWGKEYLDKFNF